VFGSGLDVVYPAENRKLAEQICEKGTIITEFPLGTSPDRGNFPQRNRIISGLCHGTLVVEAGDKSGAILTAFNAVDQSRDVFAVPGRITDKKSRGCNRLIENGAVPVKGADDIIRDINPRMFKPVTGVQKKINFDLSREEKMIFEHLDHDPIHVDDLAKAVNMDISYILQLLLKMELKNAVQQLGGKQFVKA